MIHLAAAQSYWWIGFTDKKGTFGTLSQPEAYLSEKAIERRLRQGIAIDSTDLPVSRIYTDAILHTGAMLVHTSKWLNGITVKVDHDSIQQKWSELAFVREFQNTRPDPALKQAANKFEIKFSNAAADTSLYGSSLAQVNLMGADWLHQNGYSGKGLTIAVLDAGFLNANQLPSLQKLYLENRVAGTKDFVEPGSDFYSTHVHGTMVLSVMAGYLPGSLIGTAFEASYWLIRTEDAATEYIIEEDHWVAGAEFADSLGADIINSSLGYYTFDDPATNHTYADLDGKTTRVSLGAGFAAAKGMLVFTSAGNEASKPWKYIIAPADGVDVIAVGATDRNGNYASFSSVGPASDGTIKPDLAAMGSGVTVQYSNGQTGAANGTSFASPLLAGAAATLWQASPQATAGEIRQALIQSAHQQAAPDYLLGYGIPDLRLAHGLLNNFANDLISIPGNWRVFPNPFSNHITLLHAEGKTERVTITFYNSLGEKVFTQSHVAGRTLSEHQLAPLPPGFYLLQITGSDQSSTLRVIKSR